MRKKNEKETNNKKGKAKGRSTFSAFEATIYRKPPKNGSPSVFPFVPCLFCPAFPFSKNDKAPDNGLNQNPIQVCNCHNLSHAALSAFSLQRPFLLCSYSCVSLLPCLPILFSTQFQFTPFRVGTFALRAGKGN